MFSLQRFLGRDDKSFRLMEGSAEEASSAIRNLVTLLEAPEGEHSLDVSMMDLFSEARRKEKRLTRELTEHLCRTFVTPLEREDIEALASALYRIPKTAEKFSERYMLAGKRRRGVDLSRHAELLTEVAETLVLMVRELRKGVNLETIKEQNDRMQRIEGEADGLMLESLRDLYSGKYDGLQVIVMKDLLELLEKVYDRCRDVGNTVFHLVLKHS